MNRYLTSINYRTIPALNSSVAVIGSGIAGLSAALAAADSSDVLLIAKSELSNTTTKKAQGGIAAALNEDTGDQHLHDTLKAGAGICDPEMVRLLVTEGVTRVRELIDYKVEFDHNGEDLSFTMEGGHSKRRILHANGDATGKEIQRKLQEKVRNHPNIEVLENYFAIDLIHQGGVCYGVLCQDMRDGRYFQLRSNSVVIASGGLGQVFRETTNPEIATGDGYAMAFRAGACLKDMEFIQFHPTTLYLAGAPRFLISEAVRGEGAYLRTKHGDRFMQDVHPQAELAPRDIVSRSILETLEETGTSHVVLDLTHLDRELIERRFPSIKKLCLEYGIDIVKDPIPVRPAVHYMMGGVETDREGKTSVSCLYACGEVACTGVHGANRLASNSLLEGLVFGYRAGRAAAKEKGVTEPVHFLETSKPLVDHHIALDLDDMIHSLKSLTWQCLGIYRSPQGLNKAAETIAFWEQYILREEFSSNRGFEIQNMLTVAKVMVKAALQRKESRGAHQRRDYPDMDDSKWKNSHTRISIDDL